MKEIEDDNNIVDEQNNYKKNYGCYFLWQV